jgi:hypothetical protein
MCAMTADFYPRIAHMRSYADPIQEICREELKSHSPIVCLGLSRESDSIAFYLTGTSLDVASYEDPEIARAIEKLASRDHSLLMVNELLLAETNQRLGSQRRFREIGRREHIIVGTVEALPMKETGESTVEVRDAPSARLPHETDDSVQQAAYVMD